MPFKYLFLCPRGLSFVIFFKLDTSKSSTVYYIKKSELVLKQSSYGVFDKEGNKC